MSSSSSTTGNEISRKYEIRNANGIVVGYRSPTQRAERKAVIATAQSYAHRTATHSDTVGLTASVALAMATNANFLVIFFFQPN